MEKTGALDKKAILFSGEDRITDNRKSREVLGLLTKTLLNLSKVLGNKIFLEA